ncbi:MAG: bifunctional precorrin-2 dehydrogenase/sirohydrochlorin ferrochelatase [Flavobacteriales bacterium]
MTTNTLYPIFLKLDKINTLIVGGGNIGLEKLNFILTQSPHANITIVSLEFHPEIILLAIANKNIQLLERKFVDSDLDSIKILILATNDHELNAQIYTQAHEKNILTNVVDKPEYCDFYTGAVLQKGTIKIGISSNGISPTMAKRLKQILNEAIPENISTSTEQLNKIRAQLKGNLKLKIEILNQLTEVLVDDIPHQSNRNKSSILQQINWN